MADDCSPVDSSGKLIAVRGGLYLKSQAGLSTHTHRVCHMLFAHIAFYITLM